MKLRLRASERSKYCSCNTCGCPNAYRYELNGREIKNLLRTALAIARYKKVELSEELIRTVLDLSKEHLLVEDSDSVD
jgi:hypothetical protein